MLEGSGEIELTFDEVKELLKEKGWKNAYRQGLEWKVSSKNGNREKELFKLLKIEDYSDLTLYLTENKNKHVVYKTLSKKRYPISRFQFCAFSTDNGNLYGIVSQAFRKNGDAVIGSKASFSFCKDHIPKRFIKRYVEVITENLKKGKELKQN
jgi:hypothetical protein